ncbi:FHA domain-containing protein FhaB/FipA [Bifidobacterium criceti]|uniref:Signal peptide protein n=1 Tax=Bifidobacterium criceti TaxID=1960969 RepID=A0A2A2EFA2_9BIFI|nr:FHA domain-containing protein [Bifidobacterium criceti]MEE0653669.1 FHA domain-containing protein [Bifidobacterium criceti]PAU67889.1 signal peptide protein [Bifidobacterium criceti]
MITELTFAVLKYAFLILLWLFVWSIARSLYRDVASYSPRKSRARRKKEREVRKKADVPVAATPAPSTPNHPTTGAMPVTNAADKQPTLLVIIDGPLAGTSVPLNSSVITLGRAASNTVVLDDEFVSSHHARVYPDERSHQWAIEDLHSTNGTVVNQQRITAPTLLAPRMPVRIGATTFELR